MLENTPGRASGMGSWPGTNVRETARVLFGELTEPHIPHLWELPGRGPGGELIGRGAVLLVETAVDLQPSGWRLVPRPGRDLERARAMLREDLDLLAEVAEEYVGPLKIQVTGPWTLAASLHLPRLERAVVDPGACRDLVQSLAEGVQDHVQQVRRLVAGAELIVQVDEPSLPAVLAGSLPTASGFGRLRAVDAETARQGLAEVLAAATGAGAVETLVHCCADDVPTELLFEAGADGVAVDLTKLGIPGWERLAPHLESGRRLWAGAAPSAGRSSPGEIVDVVWTPWRTLGLSPELLAGAVLTPRCGLAAGSPSSARRTLANVIAAAGELAARAQD